MKHLKWYILLAGCLYSGTSLFAQGASWHSPVEIPCLLSGSFGEPRPNHFHCGIDVKTQGVENKKILAVGDGYVSRMTVGKNGFGNALYVTHPNGLVSVYCHLNDFVPALHQLLRQQQYKEQNDEVDVRLQPGVFPVKAGMWIAYSGNTGASLAPHLHLEFQKPLDGDMFDLVDPLPYFTHLIKDNMSPKIHGIKLYASSGKGVIDGGRKTVSFSPGKDGRVVCNAWGRIGAAVWADDYMNGTGNKFGIYRITLNVDGRTVFKSELDRFRFDENPMVNAWGDYAHFRKTRHWYLKSFLEPGNKLDFITVDSNQGWVDVNEERLYHFEYILEDLKGNRTVARFAVLGKQDEMALKKEEEKERIRRNSPDFLLANQTHVVQRPGMELRIPNGALVNDERLEIKMTAKPDCVSNTYRFSDDEIPLLKRATLMISPKMATGDLSKYYIASSKGYVGNQCDDGWLVAQIRDLTETYEIMQDTVPPVIKPVGSWIGRNATILKVKVTDKHTGVKRFKANVDGAFILFVRDDNVWTCRLKESPLKKEGKMRALTIEVEDRCGNKEVYRQKFIY